jgi:hypothetical protein
MVVFKRVSWQNSTRFRKLSFYIYTIFLFSLILFFIVIVGQNIYYEKLRKDPNNELVTATAISTEHECSKGGCWYNSYGYYTIDGLKEQNVEVIDHYRYPFTGTVSILVNKNAPRLAMNPYHDPYPLKIETFAAFAVVALGLNIFNIARYRRLIKNDYGTHG